MKEHWLDRWEREKEEREDELAKGRMPKPTPAPIEIFKEQQTIVLSSAPSAFSSCPVCGCRNITDSGICPNCEVFIEVIIDDFDE